jgi:uncharacterized membrane protein YdfJ with MMPL/SSD domain
MLDTLIARTLLIPSLVSLFGRGEAKEEVAVKEAAGEAGA